MVQRRLQLQLFCSHRVSITHAHRFCSHRVSIPHALNWGLGGARLGRVGLGLRLRCRAAASRVEVGLRDIVAVAALLQKRPPPRRHGGLRLLVRGQRRRALQEPQLRQRPRGLRESVVFGTADFRPLSSRRGPQAALNLSYRSDRVTRD